MYLHRNIESDLQKYLKIFPVVALLGPRQCGKSTLVKQYMLKHENAVYLDLQNLEDLNKIKDPRLYFKANSDKIICLDEI